MESKRAGSANIGSDAGATLYRYGTSSPADKYRRRPSVRRMGVKCTHAWDAYAHFAYSWAVQEDIPFIRAIRFIPAVMKQRLPAESLMALDTTVSLFQVFPRVLSDLIRAPVAF